MRAASQHPLVEPGLGEVAVEAVEGRGQASGHVRPLIAGVVAAFGIRGATDLIGTRPGGACQRDMRALRQKIMIRAASGIDGPDSPKSYDAGSESVANSMVPPGIPGIPVDAVSAGVSSADSTSGPRSS